MSDPLIQVDRAISELRRGASVLVYAGETKLLMMAVEGVTDEKLKKCAMNLVTYPTLS